MHSNYHVILPCFTKEKRKAAPHSFLTNMANIKERAYQNERKDGMSIAKKIVSLLIVLALCLAVGGCTEKPVAGTNSDDDYVSERELASGEVADEVKAEYTVKAEAFESLEGYTVIYPDKNEQLRQAAKKLVDYFSEQEINVSISSDSAAAKDKEILVGDTNRQKSSLAENKYAVSLSGNKKYFKITPQQFKEQLKA